MTHMEVHHSRIPHHPTLASHVKCWYVKGCINSWAPEIHYDNGRFVVLFSSTVPGLLKDPNESGDIWKCKDVDTDQCNHRIYITTTTDFSQWSKAELFFDPGVAISHK